MAECDECDEAVAAAQAFSELLAEMAEIERCAFVRRHWNDPRLPPQIREEPAEAGSRTTDKPDG